MLNKKNGFTLISRACKGFTLVELLVVVAIIGILASAVGIKLVGSQKSARDARRQSDLKQYQNLLEIYSNSHNSRYIIKTGSVSVAEICSDLGVAANCENDSENPYQYQTDTLGFKYVLWAKLEKLAESGGAYVEQSFVLCSSGLSDKYVGELNVIGGTCPI